MNAPADLPAPQVDMEDVPLTAASQAERAANMLKAARLLVVDDSKMMRMGIARSLRQLGVELI
jgi:PleD family two-component response regulator